MTFELTDDQRVLIRECIIIASNHPDASDHLEQCRQLMGVLTPPSVTQPTPPAIADVWPDETMSKQMSKDSWYGCSDNVDKLLARIRELQADRLRLLGRVRATIDLLQFPDPSQWKDAPDMLAEAIGETP